jgi:nicotinamide mononucleotide transporter
MAMHILKRITISLILGSLVTLASYLLAVSLGLLGSISDVDPLEFFAVATSYSCTYLCVVQSRWNYPIGMITTAAYTVLFWKWGLLASSVLNALLAVYLVYGWFRWRPDAITRPVTKIGFSPWLLGYAAIVSVTYFLLMQAGHEVARWTGTDFAFIWTDSVILAATILAQLLMDNKRLESWGVWILVNIFSIYTYYEQGLYIVTIQYVLFIVYDIFGYLQWRQTLGLYRLRADYTISRDEI